MIDDYYAILGVGRDATLEEIERSYRQIALKCHPDLHPGNVLAARLFRTLQRAVEALRDPVRRAAYDQQLHEQDPVVGIEISDERSNAADTLSQEMGDATAADDQRRRHSRNSRRAGEQSGDEEGSQERRHGRRRHRRSPEYFGERSSRSSGRRRRRRRESGTGGSSKANQGERNRDQGERNREAPRPRYGWAVVVGAFVLAAGPVWVALQLWKTSDLLQRVQSLEQQQDYRAAAELANQYVRFRPRNAEGVVAQAVNLARASNSADEEAEVAGLLRRALMLAPDEPKVLRELARLSLKGNSPSRYSTAEMHADHLLRLNEHDGEAWRLKVQALEGQLDLGDESSVQRAIDAYRKAMTHNPADVGIALRLAEILRHEHSLHPQGNSTALANQTLDTLVQRNPTLPGALTARYRYRVTHQLPGGDADLDAALKTDDDDSIWLDGLRQLEWGRPWAAAEAFGRLIGRNRGNHQHYLGLALAQLSGGGPEVALSTLAEGARVFEGQGPLVALVTGRCQLELQHLDAAQRYLVEVKGALAAWSVRAADDEAADLQHAALILEGGIDRAKLDYSAAVPKLRRALMLMFANERKGEASRRLQLRMAPAAIDVAARLADCYLALGEAQEAAAVYAALREMDDARLFAHWAPARIWLDAGHAELASDLLGKEAKLTAVGVRDAVQFARGQLLVQARRCPPQQDWRAVDQAWARLEESAVNEQDWVALDAERRRLTQGGAAAEARLRETLDLAPNDRIAEEALGRLLIDQRRFADAQRLLDDLDRQHGPSNSVAMMRLETLQGQGQSDAAIEFIRVQAAGAPLALRVLWLRQLAGLYVEKSDWHLAWRCLCDALNLAPQDHRTKRTLCELAAVRPQDALLIECERVLRRSEGETGAVWRCLRGLRQLAHADSAAHVGFVEARKLEQEIGQTRQAWPKKLMLRAVLARIAGDDAKEMQALRQLAHFENDGLFVNQRLFAALVRQGRAFEAWEHLERFARTLDRQACLDPQGQLLVKPPVARLELLAVARAELADAPSDHVARTWAAFLFHVCGQTAEAAATLDEEGVAPPASAEAIAAWAACAAALHDHSRSENVLAAIKRDTRLPRADRKFLAGQAAVLAGDSAVDTRLARLQFRQPKRPGVAYVAAKHFSSRNRSLARTAVLEALPDASSNRHNRVLLAEALAAHGQRPEWTDAWEEILGGEGEANYPTDQHLTRVAQLLAKGGSPELDQALKRLVERCSSDLVETTDDLWLQACLLKLRSQSAESESVWGRLLDGASEDPLYVETYVDHLLEQRRSEEAAEWLERLEALDPKNPQSLRLRARLGQQQNQPAKAIEAEVESRAQRMLAEIADPILRRRLFQFTADAFHEIGNAAAQRWQKPAEVGEDSL